MPSFDLTPFLKEGREVERRFAQTLYNINGGLVEGSDEETDMKRHIDVFWTPSDISKRRCSFDVKGMKKDKRTDENVNPEIEWVEFQNVNGERGWVNGDADYIAFENPDDWIIIRRAKLKKLIEEEIHDKSITNDRTRWFRYYQRQGRKDKVVKVPTSFIRKNANKIIIKREFIENSL